MLTFLGYDRIRAETDERVSRLTGGMFLGGLTRGGAELACGENELGIYG